jgi:hypothetical protein
VTAVEVEGDDVSNSSGDSAWGEGILSTLTNLDSEGGGNGARDKSKKRECVDHVERLYNERMRRNERVFYLMEFNEEVLGTDQRRVRRKDVSIDWRVSGLCRLIREAAKAILKAP